MKVWAWSGWIAAAFVVLVFCGIAVHLVLDGERDILHAPELGG